MQVPSRSRIPEALWTFYKSLFDCIFVCCSSYCHTICFFCTKPLFLFSRGLYVLSFPLFYMNLFFKPFECMDAVCVIYLFHYEPMKLILCFEPSSFCGNKRSLYSCNIVAILLKLIVLVGGAFFNNHKDFFFTWIISTM